MMRRKTVLFALVLAAFPAFVRSNVEAAETVALDVNALCEQVTKKQALAIRYSNDPVSAPARELLPYAVGYAKKRDVLLFGLQVRGYSKSAASGESKLPSWRNFRLDRVRSIEKGDGPFSGFNPEDSELRAISEFACKNEVITRGPK